MFQKHYTFGNNFSPKINTYERKTFAVLLHGCSDSQS